MDGENGAGSQLHHPIGCRTKHCYIQSAAATHSHSHHVDLCVPGKLDDLLVGFSDAHRRLNLEGLASLWWNQLIQSLCRYRHGLFCLGRTWDSFQHVQQCELRVVLCCRRDRIFQRQLRILGEIRTEKNSAQVVDVAPLFTCGRICCQRLVRRLTYCQHRAGSPAHHPVGHRPQHQAIKSSPAVRSHDDHVRFLCLRKRQNRVRCHSLVHYEL